MAESNELHKAIKEIHHIEADMAFQLDLFGDRLAKREGYKAYTGIEAVHFYLVQKFGWTPEQVRSMKAMDIRFVLREEME